MAISRIDQWATSVGFRFSTEKTKAIVFYRDKRWIKDQEIELKFRNTSIRFYENVKFLGLIFDQHLNWKAHIRHVKGRALKAMNLIKKLSHVSWGADRKTLMMLYKSTVLSIMDYGSPIYSSASDAALKILDPVHHLGIRLATGAFKSSPVTSLIAESGELPLYNRFEQNTMQRALKLKISQSPVRELFINTDQMPNCKQKPSLPIRANTFFNDYNINVNEINNFEYNFPPWTIKLPNIFSKLNNISKRNINDNVLKQLTEEHKNEHADSIAIYTDGSKSKDGVGFAVISTTFQIKSSLPNNASIYTAELMAIKSALIKVIRLNLRKVVLYSDSLSAIEGINSFRFKNSIVLEIQAIIHQLKQKNIQIILCWIPAHIGIRGNEEADSAAKEAINSPRITNRLPVNDHASRIKDIIRNKWQTQWSNIPLTNKLRNIKDTSLKWKSSLQNLRIYEVVLARLRIGHTNMTHGHLMCTPHNPPPICDACRVEITVQHILKDCTKFNQVRPRYFREKSLKEILAESEEFSSDYIFMFLNRCNILKSI